MKNYKIGILLLTLVWLAFGCSDDDPELITPYLKVGEKVLSFDDKVTHTLPIEANGHWKIRLVRDTTEFTVSPLEGNGNGDVTITLNRTKVGDVRGFIKVTYMDGKDEGLEVAYSVKLLASKLNMQVSPGEVTLNSAVGYSQQPLQVDVEGKWTAMLADTTWCTLDRTAGEGKDRINLTLKDGAKAKNKSTEVVIVPEAYPGVKYVVKVSELRAYAPGECMVVNKASVGKGIDVVLLGEFFTADDLEKGGRWEEACRLCNRYLFAMEPYRSYREYFNVYAVASPSERDLWGTLDEVVKTSFGTYQDGDVSKAFTSNRSQEIATYKYAYAHTPVQKDKGSMTDLLVAIVINTDNRNFGANAKSNNKWNDQEYGMAIAPIPVFAGNLNSLIGSQLLGIGFGDLQNEFVVPGKGEMSQAAKDHYMDQQKKGIFLDVAFSNDPDKFANRAWAELYRMNYRNVDIIEGAMGYESGIWRSSYDNVMAGNGAVREEEYYCPVQRELILRKIYRLAGFEEEYSLQTFLDYDVINKELDEKMMEKYNPEL